MAEIIQVDTPTLEQMMADGAVIVDVRTPAEWQLTGVLPGSHLKTFFDAQGGYDAEAWLAGLDEVAPDGAPVVLLCASGGRTMSIAHFLTEQLGRDGVHNVTGGINAWIGSGGATVRPSE